MRAVVLGLDVGTTSAKVTAFAANGERLGDAEVGYPLDEPAPGAAEQDPQTVVDAVVAAARQAAAQARDGGAQVAGLACSTAMHGLVGVDAGDRAAPRVPAWGGTR